VSRCNEYQLIDSDALWLQSKGGYGARLVAGKTVWFHVSYLSTLEINLVQIRTAQIRSYFALVSYFQWTSNASEINLNLTAFPVFTIANK